MRVWHVVSNRWNSAIAEYSLASARSTQMLGWDTYFTALNNSPIQQRARNANLRCIPVSEFNIRSWKNLKTIRDQLNPNFIFTYGGPETTFFQFFKGKESKLFRFRGDQRVLRTKDFRLNNCRLDGVLFPSRIMAKTSIHDNSHVITLGCDSSKFRFQSISRGDYPTLLIVGRFDPIKGHREFFPIFKKFIEQWPSNRPPLKLKIIGQPANIQTKELHKHAERVGLNHGDHYELISERVAHIEREMAAATLGVISSLGSETICRVAEEFLLCGTKVLSTPVGSLTDTVFEGGGLVLPTSKMTNKIADISALIWNSYNEPDSKRILLAEQAENSFSLTSMANQIHQALLKPEQG